MENYVPVGSYAGRPDTILEQIHDSCFPIILFSIDHFEILS